MAEQDAQLKVQMLAEAFVQASPAAAAMPGERIAGSAGGWRAALEPRPPCPTSPTGEELGGRPATASVSESASERAGGRRQGRAAQAPDWLNIDFFSAVV